MTTLREPALERSTELLRSQRRAAFHYPCRVRVVFQPGIGQLEGFWWRATVFEVSREGVGLLLSHRFEPGTELTVEMPPLRQFAARKLLVRVAQVVGRADNRWVAGCVPVDSFHAEKVADA